MLLAIILLSLCILIVFMIFKSYKQAKAIVPSQRYEIEENISSDFLENILFYLAIISIVSAFAWVLEFMRLDNKIESEIALYGIAGCLGSTITFFIIRHILKYLRISTQTLKKINKKLDSE